MSNADAEDRSVGRGRIHQDEFPRSHVYRYEAQRRKKTKIPLPRRRFSLGGTWRQDGGAGRTLNSCFLPKRLMSDTSLAVSPTPYSKASTRRDDGPVSGLASWVGTWKSLLSRLEGVFLSMAMIHTVDRRREGREACKRWDGKRKMEKSRIEHAYVLDLLPTLVRARRGVLHYLSGHVAACQNIAHTLPATKMRLMFQECENYTVFVKVTAMI